jgi:hypothetical protein
MYLLTLLTQLENPLNSTYMGNEMANAMTHASPSSRVVTLELRSVAYLYS